MRQTSTAKQTKIGEDKHLKNQLNTTGSKKVKLAQEVIKMLKDVGFEISDYRAFDKSFTKYIDEAILSRADVFKYMDIEYAYEVNKLNRNEILRKEILYKQLRVELNEDLTEVILPDTNIYAASEDEQERTELSEKLAEIIQAVKKHGYHVDVIALNKIMPLFDGLDPKSMKPNVAFVKGHRIN